MDVQIDYKILYEEALKTIADQTAKIGDQALKIEELSHQLEQLRKMLKGSKQERFVADDPDNLTNKNATQLALDLAVETIATTKITKVKEVTYTRPTTETNSDNKPHPGRMALPEHLRRETIVVEPDTRMAGMKKIGQEVTEILDYTPGELFVRQYVRPKYAIALSDTDNTVITASLPERMMEKCMFGEALMAKIIVDKFVDHIPLDRQQKRFEREGVKLPSSTLISVVKRVADALICLYESHKKIVLDSRYLHADETPIKVLDKNKKGTTHQGFYWVYHNSKDKLVLFDYRTGRGREGPNDILKDFEGYLQTDGYVAYEAFEKRSGITVLNCMAHARRKFKEAEQNDPDRARHALLLFQKLYDTERTIKNERLSEDDVLAFRQQQAVPVLQELEQWMKEESAKLPPKSTMGKAIAYCLARWEKLTLYTTDPVLLIDNNPVENMIRPIAIGRKNYLFAGSHNAAERAAMIYSLFATCRLHGINPQEWLHHVLKRMHLYTTANIHELLPQYWKKSNA